jgi:hypothetical protein
MAHERKRHVQELYTQLDLPKKDGVRERESFSMRYFEKNNLLKCITEQDQAPLGSWTKARCFVRLIQ